MTPADERDLTCSRDAQHWRSRPGGARSTVQDVRLNRHIRSVCAARAGRSGFARSGLIPHGGSDGSWPIRLAHRTRAALFLNLRGEKLTRFGVYTLLKKRIELCAPAVATLRGRRIHPHTLRHTTAVHLLKAGVDFATISQWLGMPPQHDHGLCARDMELKRQALAQVFPDAPRPPRGGRLRTGNSTWSTGCEGSKGHGPPAPNPAAVHRFGPC